MRGLAFLAVLLACSGPPKQYEGGTVEPGSSVSLAALVATAAGAAAVTWSVDPGGGVVSQTGIYTAPSCSQLITALGAPDISKVGLITGTDRVHAVWSGGSVDISITVAESVLGIAITPTNPSVPPGGTIQFTATITYTCHNQVTP